MEEILDRILKRCKRNTQELNNSINRQNLWIMGIDEERV
jgi:hypothetical protein